MTEDILRQAELRHQRRPKSTSGEEIVTLDSTKIKTSSTIITTDLSSKSSLPPIRHGGQDRTSRSPSPRTPRTPSPFGNKTFDGHTTDQQQNKKEMLSMDNSSALLSPLDRPRTPRRRVMSNTETDDVNGFDEHINGACLPFVKCMIRDREMKALLNTTSTRSTINRRCYDNNRHNSATPPHEIKLANTEFPINFTVDETAIHELTLGMDFLCKNKCVMDLSSKVLKISGGKTTPLLAEQDMPLKFRNKREPSLSM